MSHRPILILVLMVFLFSLVPFALFAADGPTAAEYGVVLNLSGKQRMLSQKMSKEILLVALDVQKEENLANLEKTAALFDKTLRGLRDGDAELRLPPTTGERILRQLGDTAKIWEEYHALIKEILAGGRVSNEQVAKAASINLPLLQEMNRCVMLYEKDASRNGLKADPGLAVAINLSGKQRMLTQKMSKEFLLVAHGHDVQNNKLNLLETSTLFERTLNGLRDGDETLDLPGTKQPEIRKQLEVVMRLWKEFKPLVEYGVDPAHATIPAEKVEQIAKSNLPLLAEMNTAVSMYEEEAAK